MLPKRKAAQHDSQALDPTESKPKRAKFTPSANSSKAAKFFSPVVVRRVPDIVQGVLLERYKRFLANVQVHCCPTLLFCWDPLLAVQISSQHVHAAAVQLLDDATGSTVVHVPNTGAMTGLLDQPLVPCWLSRSAFGCLHF